MNSIFDTYSNRPKPKPHRERKALTTAFKNRTLSLCLMRFKADPPSEFVYEKEFWSKIYRSLVIITGIEFSDVSDLFPRDAITNLLDKNNDTVFLDFVELIFKVQADYNDVLIGGVSPNDINELFNQSDLPYCLTEYEVKGQDFIAFPKVITRDSEAIHQLAIKPALDLLRERRFQGANQEFMGALQHFRKKEFGHCVAMCGSSLESTMKTICIIKGWEKKPDSLTGSDLLKTITKEFGLKPYYKKLTELTHVIRDNESTVHGGRKEIRNPPQHIAQFVINMTASTILLLVEQADV